MPKFTFEETCTSRPCYVVKAETLEEAVFAYKNGKGHLRSEEVEENYLIDVACDGYSIIKEAEELGLEVVCRECRSGPFASGMPGILARMENGRVAPGCVVERCDYCQRFDSDESAAAHLRQLGMA